MPPAPTAALVIPSMGADSLGENGQKPIGKGSKAGIVAIAGFDESDDAYCYDTQRTWAENLAAGLPPSCCEANKDRCWAPEDKWIDFLGHKLASPLGVAAGPLLSSDWVALAASSGYDCLTYKTIRSHYHTGHGLPNILLLDVAEQLPAAGDGAPLRVRPSRPSAACGPAPPLLAITNSFGMPSQGPAELARDIPRAAGALRAGQMMVVSITGTPGLPGVTFGEDLLQAARVAVGAGATALEANLSCPNVGSSHVALYQDPPAVEELLAAVKQEFPAVPLAFKVGAYADGDAGQAEPARGHGGAGQDCLRRVLVAAEAAGARAVAGINGLSRRVEDGAGRPALGPDRPSSGVCGEAIRGAGLAFVSQARQVIASGGLALQVAGVGGVAQAEHVMEYLAAGADVVQTATGFMWRPTLGTDFQRLWAAAGFTRPAADGRGCRA